MKKLIDFKEEVYKCSKCGLCQSVCPIYKATLKESAVSRGKFIILNGIIKGDLTLNKNVKKIVDNCLNCNACKNFCPSNIDSREIFTTVKNEYFKKYPFLFFEKLLFSPLTIKILFSFISIFLKLYRFLKIDLLIQKNEKTLLNLGFIGQNLVFLNSAVKINVKRKKHNTNDKKNIKIVYFQGCINKYINPSVKNSVLNILEEKEIEIITPDFNCCGIINISKGFPDKMPKIIDNFLKKLPEDFDYILTDCATCNFMLNEYSKYNEKAKIIDGKIIDILELLEKIEYKKTFNEKQTITYHKPCHSNFNIKDILKNIDNIEYIQAENYDECCGLAGTYKLSHPKISTKISTKKALSFQQTKADTILTSCPACILGIKQGLINIKDTTPVQNIIEFLAK